MKRKKDGLKLLLIMLGGGVVGFFGSTLFFLIDDSIDLTNIGDSLSNHMIINIIWYQIGTVILLLVPAIYWLMRAKRLSERGNDEVDIEEDTAGQLFEKFLNRSLLANSLYFIFAFILFAIGADDRNPFFWGSLVVFGVFMFISSMLETNVIRSLQKYDPMKKGEPTSIKFGKQFLDSCDEAERQMIYKTGFESFSFMQVAIIIIFTFTIFTKLMFNAGNFPILLVGLIWLVQILSYFYYAAKNEQ